MAADLHFGSQVRTADVWVARASNGAAALRNAGLHGGRKLAVLLPNCIEYPEVLRAIGLAGSYAVPLSTHLSPGDLAALIARERFDALIGTRGHLDRCVDAGRALQILVGDGPGTTWDDLVASGEPDPECEGAAPGTMFFTSGSTRFPKTVTRLALPPALARLRNERFEKAWRMEPGMRTVITGPIYHQAPLYYLMGSAGRGERVAILERFTAVDILEAIEKHSVTHLHMVPRLMQRLDAMSEEERRKYDVSSVRFVLHGAAACPTKVKRSLIDWWGPIFREYYSASEFGPISHIDSADWLERPRSVGRPSPGVEVRVSGPDGSDLPNGEFGRLYARSDDMPTFSYRSDEDATPVEFTRNEWVTVNDRGMVDSDGFIHLDGRMDDVAVVSGVNVGAAATLSALLELPYVRDAVVEIVSDEDRGEAFSALLVLEPGVVGVDADRVNSDLRGTLASFSLPRDVGFRTSLPVNDAGKTIRRYLRDTET